MKMLLRALVFALAATRSNSAQVSLQFTRTTHRNAAAWKLPSFIKSGRVTGRQRNPPPVSTTVSQVLLEVRGGSDNYSGNDPDGRYYNNYDNDYSRRRPNKDKRDDYYEEKRVDDYYYGEQPDGSYYEEDRHYEEYDDRGRGGVSILAGVSVVCCCIICMKRANLFMCLHSVLETIVLAFQLPAYPR